MLPQDNTPFALFDDATWPDRPAMLFVDPIDEILITDPNAVAHGLAQLDDARSKGLTIAGYFAYELGYCFEPRLRSVMPSGPGPLMRFCVFQRGESLDARARDRWLIERAGIGSVPSHLHRDISAQTYKSKFDIVHALIGSGDVYQVNFTFKLQLQNADCDRFALYRHLRERSRSGACAFLHFDDEDILSFSPETFFTVEGSRIRVKPMKGTCTRVADPALDKACVRELQADPKQRAENLMIVDLMRNDIARVCVPGSVSVDDMFTAETYPTYHTLTSTVSGELSAPASLATLVPALFPCGSVTGAPKIRAMEIIRQTEAQARGVYCGAIGFASGTRMAFNVAIRTVAFSHGEGELGIGGGIVWDSDADSEFNEALLKARFFTEKSEPFRLLETMRWDPQSGIYLIERHLQRLARSAEYFGFRFDRQRILEHLNRVLLDANVTSRVRLTLGVRGDTQIETSPFETHDPELLWRFVVSDQHVSSTDWRLYHKTTRREVYDEAQQLRALHPDLEEVVLLNERGEITEGCRSNIFVESEGVWLTPPLSSGVLDGCLRRELMENGPQMVVERVLRPTDLAKGTIWFGNSLRGLIRGHWVTV